MSQHVHVKPQKTVKAETGSPPQTWAFPTARGTEDFDLPAPSCLLTSLAREMGDYDWELHHLVMR